MKTIRLLRTLRLATLESDKNDKDTRVAALESDKNDKDTKLSTMESDMALLASQVSLGNSSIINLGNLATRVTSTRNFRHKVFIYDILNWHELQ